MGLLLPLPPPLRGGGIGKRKGKANSHSIPERNGAISYYITMLCMPFPRIPFLPMKFMGQTYTGLSHSELGQPQLIELSGYTLDQLH